MHERARKGHEDSDFWGAVLPIREETPRRQLRVIEA